MGTPHLLPRARMSVMLENSGQAISSVMIEDPVQMAGGYY